MLTPQEKAGPGGARLEDPGFGRLRAVADAVLYEGYLLYPYRRSSPKNRVRWQFGVLAQRPWVEGNGPLAPGVTGAAESWYQQTECLFEAADDAVLRVRMRHLQLQHKGVERRDDDGGYTPVESLEAGDVRHLTFDEAVPRESDLVVPAAELLAGDRTFSVGAPAGVDTELLADGAGRVVRRRHAVEATTTLHAEPVDAARGLHRLRIRTENTGQSLAPGAPREEALRSALVAAHTLVGGSGLGFLSLTDPPEWAEPHARACRNLYTFPVLAGDAGGREKVLSSPIILSDHPQVAPESPGDLHDSAEIDEILSLRTLLLTDEEKREARATDRRAAEILDRVDTMPPETFARLHGVIRSLRPSPGRDGHDGPGTGEPVRPTVPWWEEGGDDGLSPATDSVLVDGVEVSRGSRVRLCPRSRGADAHDMFLAGRAAHVVGVFHDVDGSLHVAVELEDDPGAELNTWYGRYRYFRPDEIEPLGNAPTEKGRDGRHRAAEA